MKTKRVLFINLVIAFIMTACGGSNSSGWDEASLTIKFIGNMGSELDCKVDISGPTPLSLEAKSGDIIQTKVAVGDYNITVKAFSGATEYANGKEEIKIVAGNNYANIVLNKIGSVATPQVNLPGGTYAKPQTIILETDTDGAIIYYTLDGSDPKTSPTHKEYIGEFILDNGTVTLKVIAVDGKGYLFDSLILEADYTINPAYGASSAKTITEFSFLTIPSAVIIINEGAKTINVTVPYGTDVTSLTPMITHTGVSYSPTATQDFTTSKTYTITAEDGSTAIYTATVNIAPPSSKKAITTFSFPTIPSAVIEINESVKTINVTVPYGTDVTSLEPAITHTGVSYSPTVVQNFSTSKSYTVTAEDGSTQNYIVTVNFAPSNAKTIVSFSFPTIPSAVVDINESAKTINVTVPYGSDITSLTPAITHTGASYSPMGAQNFSIPRTYTITAEDSTGQNYMVTVNIAPNDAKTIESFSFPTIPSAVIDINESAKTINVTVPYGTDITSLAPAITHTGVSYSPMGAQNFSTSKTYKVTAEDGSTAIYTATVNIAPPSSKKAITAFSFPTIPSAVIEINESVKTINVIVPYGTDITSLEPAITHTGVSYSPTGAQNFSTSKIYTITAEDGSTQNYTVTVNIAAAAPGITTTSLPGGVGGEAYSQTLTATGTAPITWSIYSGNLPDGLSLNSTNGTISGDPTVADTFNFTVKAENSAGSDTKPFSIVIAPGGEVATPTANLPAGMVVSGRTVELTTTTIGADIWYTTNGATPAEGTGTKYTTPITITAAMTIKAIAVKAGMIGSGILEVAYILTIIDTEWIPAGIFWMGSPTTEPDRSSSETQHEVTLTTGFYMGKYQVTQGQYFAVMGTEPSYHSSNPYTGEVQVLRPVEWVSWYDAIVFCNKLSVKEGLTPAYSINGSTDPEDWGTVPTSSDATWNAVEIVSVSTGYRLPTEAQWEYACRAGTTTAYHTGDDAIDPMTGWYTSNSVMTHQVGLKAVNAFGLYDMHGNVYEWCWDWGGSYGSSPLSDPEGPIGGSNRVMRGGSWANLASELRSAHRVNYDPSGRTKFIGFRVVRP